MPAAAVFSVAAVKELKKLGPAHAAALFDAFSRRAETQLLPREDELFPVGKGRHLNAIRAALGKTQLRLIYVRVRADRRSGEAAQIRIVGLLAYRKKTEHAPDHLRDVAWQRSEVWLEAHPGYERE